MNWMKAISSAFSVTSLMVVAAPSASASFLDEDFYCRTYGCVVVHDGRTYDIYDNYIFAGSTCCVAVGAPMIPYYHSSGTLKPNFTDTLNAIDDPGPGSGALFDITDGNGNVINAVLDDGDGFLDAGDSLSVFGLDAFTDVTLTNEAQNYSHSFYITSRNTRFSLRGQANMANSTGDLKDSVTLADIGFVPSITRRGNDDGFDFGRRTNRGQIKIDNGLNTLDDISGIPTEIISFNRNAGIRQRNGDINDQVIRLDFLYTLPKYDFSMGVGDLDMEVVFDFYRE